jgi:hypothetical protein
MAEKGTGSLLRAIVNGTARVAPELENRGQVPVVPSTKLEVKPQPPTKANVEVPVEAPKPATTEIIQSPFVQEANQGTLPGKATR